MCVRPSWISVQNAQPTGVVMKIFTISFLLILGAECVPPRTPDTLQDDLDAIKSALKQLSAQMDKLNYLYLNNLEPKVAMTATTLAGIDSSVHSLQERSHVWDTFQLYIASWNDQMSTTDRKLDIISKGQQKLFALDAKVNTLVALGLEYKVESVLKKLAYIEDNVTTLSKRAADPPRDVLFSEFATRGILSTVKSIERKLEKAANTTQPCVVEDHQELLADIASKVDVIFDRTNSKDGMSHDSGEEDDVEGSADDGELRCSRKTIKNTPCLLMNKILNEISVKVNDTSTNTAQLINDQRVFTKKFDEQGTNQVDSLRSYFNEQRAHFESILKKTSYEKQPPKKINTTLDRISCADFPVPTSGVYTFKEKQLYCEVKDSRVWTVVQRRQNSSKQLNFSLSWEEYKNGFGDAQLEFWIGNDILHTLTANSNLSLRIELEDFEDNTAWAEYDTFSVGSEEENYVLKVNGYKGNASDAFSSHDQSMFSTYDRTNDKAPACCPCAVSYGGGWWFNSCFEANLNGVYQHDPRASEYFKGIIWETWLGNYSLRKSTMMVRERVDDGFKSGSTTEKEIVATTPEIPFYEDP